MSRKGLFLVIEGTDGSGKGTQFKLLSHKLALEGYQVETFDFPQYGDESSYFVREYLNGKYGTAEEVGPYTGSLFYALDRYSAAPKIKKALDEGKIVLANRFTGSNMAHQGTKFDNPEERKGYFLWIDAIEFRTLGIPRPDASLVLRVPADTAQKLVDKKDARNYTDKKRDLHEADITHMRRSVEVYDNLCQLFPKDFKQLDCVRNGELLDIETIHNIIWETVMPLLPSKNNKSAKKPPNSDMNSEQSKAQPLVAKDSSGSYRMTEAGKKALETLVTNTQSDVYGFYGAIDPVTVAAAMARLSRRGDDMRITLLDEFMGEAGKDEQLLKRVITAYGDDSVQQLVGQHIVVEGASNILTKKLEWGRLAAYLEQSTRYIYFDQKDQHGKYRYFTPGNLDDDTARTYNEIMDKIFDLYSSMVHKLTDYVQSNSSVPKDDRDLAWRGATRAQACDAIRPVLPVATKSTVGIFASGQALESLIMHLLSDELLEARETGQKMLSEARKTVPMFLERADKPDRGGAAIAYRAETARDIADIASKNLPDTYSTNYEPVELVEVWPRNEIDLVPDMLYEYTGLSKRELREAVKSWSYNKKLDAFDRYIGKRLNRRQRPGRALENAHYSWDLVCDYGIFRDLQRHRMVDDLAWQQLTPRYGYDVPELVQEADLTDSFQECFDLSLQLYSILQAAGFALEAQYATLLGHKMRWKMTFNAREAFHFIELRTAPQGHPGYRKLTHQMYEKLCEVHPMLGAAMKFVNKDEDPELTRLAAERYTHFKLKQI